MTDIIERLRAIDEDDMYYAPATTKATIDEAADTIEQLRARIAEMEGAVLAEREACAKVAARSAMMPNENWPDDECEGYENGALDTSMTIAAAIRDRTDGR